MNLNYYEMTRHSMYLCFLIIFYDIAKSLKGLKKSRNSKKFKILEFKTRNTIQEMVKKTKFLVLKIKTRQEMLFKKEQERETRNLVLMKHQHAPQHVKALKAHTYFS